MKILLVIVATAVVFLVGFVPQYLENRELRAEKEVIQAQVSRLEEQATIDGIRNLGSRMYLEVSRLNYGTAANTSTQYFDKVAALAAKTDNEALKSSLSELLRRRDVITSALAQGNSSVASDLQSLMQRTYELPDAVSR